MAAGADTRAASFQLDRFEWTAPDRLEVAGRWFGVRGIRFIRPVLEFRSSDGRHRALALLEHKPWAAEDGEEWVAAVPWDGDRVEPVEVELAVAPSVTIELPVVGAQSNGGSKDADGNGSARIRASRVRAELPDNRPLVEAQELREERDTAIAARDAAARERDVALAARDAAVRERDEAIRARDRMAQDRDVAIAARSAALSELESAMKERDAALGSRKALVRRAEVAEAEHDSVKSAMQALRREREASSADLDDVRRQLETARHEGEQLRAQAEPVVRDPTRPLTPAVDWRARLPALAALIILLLVVALFISGWL